MTFGVSIIPLIIGAVFNMGLGALWYSKVLFAEPWMKAAGITDEDISDTSGMGTVYLFTMISAVVTSYVIGFIVVNMGISGLWQAIVLSVVLWLGTDTPMIIKNWGFEKRSIKLGIINHGYQWVVYLVVAVLFTVL